MARPTYQLSNLSVLERSIVDKLRYARDPESGKPLPPERVAREICDHVIRHENSRGSATGPAFVVADGRHYFIDKIDGRIYPLTLRNHKFASFLAYRYGLSSSEPLTRQVIDLVNGHVATHGDRRMIRRFSYFDRQNHVLYLNRYDGTCYRLDGQAVTIVTNGRGVLFMDYDDSEARTPEVDLRKDLQPHGALKDMLVDGMQFKAETNAGTTAAEQSKLFLLWILVTAFPDLMPSKPLLLIEGDRGSGKTTSVQLTQLALLGKHMTMSVGKNDEDDFGVMILRSPIALIDNNDTMMPWMQDALAGYTTGAGWLRRMKYTDDEVVEINPQSFLAIATRNPVTFKRDDVADRCLILRLENREGRGGYTDLDSLMNNVLRDRHKIYGEWLYYLNRAIWMIKSGQFHLPEKMAHRTADFGRMAYLLGASLNMQPDEIEAVLTSAQNERDDLVSEGDTLIDIVTAWMEANNVAGREYTAQQVYESLHHVARSKHLDLYHKSPASLVKRLERQTKAMAKHFAVTRRQTGHHQITYSFRRAH